MFLNPYINQEEEAFYDNVRKFAREKVFPTVEERDANATWDDNLWQEMGQLGLHGIAVPEEYGGQGATCLQCCHASEAFNSGSADGGLGLAWGAHTIIGTLPIVFFGNDEQKQKYLPKLATGEWIAGLGLTEPGSGSDAAGMATFAKKNGSGYIMNGSKMFITNGPIGQVFVVMARTAEKKSRGPMGISAFIVEKDYPGFSVSKVLRKLGHHTSTTAELSFDDMQMPEEALLGPLNSGFMRIGRSTLEWERTVLIAALVGGNEFSLDTSMRYALERAQFGKPIISFYAIQEKLAKSWIYMQAGRRYLYYVARRKDAGDNLPMQSSILKLITSEGGEEVASETVQLHGGYGYMREYHVERFYRDIKLGTIGGGTSEVQRAIVASVYPGYEKFMQGLELAIDDAARDGAQAAYGSSIAGSELELMVSLQELLKSVGAEAKKAQNQSVNFALADLIMMVSLLVQSYWDVASNLSEYPREARKRDFVLLSWFLMGKYFRSIQTLATLDEKAAKAVCDAYVGLRGIEELVDECVNY